MTNLILPMGLGEATIDLDNVPYFVQLGTGPLDGNGHMTYHLARTISENQFTF